MRALFLVEAGRRVGMGHLMRCRSLMLELERSGADIELWLKGDPEATSGRAWPAGIRIHANPDSLTLTQAEGALEAMLSECRADWVVADGYGFHGHRLHDIATSYRAGLLVVDDVPERTLTADIILNQNLSDEEAYATSQLRAKRYLLGTRYALIAKEYREAKWRPIDHVALQRILVTFGGLDARGLSEKVVNALDTLSGTFEIDVVVGPFHPFEDELRRHRGPHDIRVHKGLSSLAPLMEACDLMISAAGSTTWEACCVGAPLVLIQTQGNQAEVVNTVRAAGAGVCLDATKLLAMGDETLTETIVESVTSASDREMRKAYSERAKRLVDGHGAERVVAAMREHKI
ncbi:MAG: UDP-2,4-diacetamido-2,4,6-trideoxy-beta-L-altropyranose hydrolase [SAR202 cluster bacterium]|nr:UDP-2,4-diacetamido-2,4,6-trideoxy-beta-L-altropyranose hydrolase [SAR202 cluster bacterium]